ncbi:hypothetical protein IDJ81_11330 [Tsuneonella flava]|uniref:Uncharacterized protein n=1 Tax=Tsuneonella flava TaxID=2055955 RepID=A0ABX7K9J5_9SPHN|nr:hypothetical protein [Tsuneonella flava]QSB43934.1 hypothetical protein IDJ81_11330 [Tsuneonella flava]
MSKEVSAYVSGLCLCAVLLIMDSTGVLELGSFVIGLALMVAVFAILTFSSTLKNRKAKNG